MNLLLISKVPIVKQLFTLVSKKANFTISITDKCDTDKEFDLIIIDDELLDSEFPAKSHSKRVGIITKNKDIFSKKCDFIISKPFLPSVLMQILEEQIKLLNVVDKKEATTPVNEEDSTTSDAVNFIETLVEDISDEIMEETDESIVPTAFVENGGILDSNELSKIQNMLNNDTDVEPQSNEVSNNVTQTIEEDEDWIDLSNIIDKAIEEVREYKFNVKEPIKLTLNEYSMKELSPLLNKLDQNIIDSLTNGEEISLKLKVEN